MSDCIGCNNSNTTYSRCNPPVSTNCVFYQGDPKTCKHDPGFSICKGDNLSNVQGEIFDRICQLIGDTSVKKVVIPDCLEDAWNKNDLTILNLFNFTLSQQCLLKDTLDEITSTQEELNPYVTILPICSCKCTTCTVRLRLTDALNGIIKCLCDAKARITSLENTVAVLGTDLDDIKSTYDVFNTFISTFTCTQASVTCRLDYIDNHLDIDSKSGCFPCP